MTKILPPINSIELFTGAGGLALGFAQSGCHPIAMFENNSNSCNTVRHNIETNVYFKKNVNIYQLDVRQIDYSLFKNKGIDAVIGGPPCQPFSLGGIARGQIDSRDMFPETVRAIRSLKPKLFVFENVKGLLRQSFASYFRYIVLQFTYPLVTINENEKWTNHLSRLEKLHLSDEKPDLSYRVNYHLLNAVDFGIPQHRHRVFIVGFRSDLGIQWHFPSVTHSLDRLLWEQWYSGEYWDEHQIAKKNRPEPSPRLLSRITQIKKHFNEFSPVGKRYRTVRDALIGLPDPRSSEHSFSNHEFRDGAKPYHGHTGSLLDEPSKALKAGAHGVPGGENMIAFPDGSYRYYTAREAARVQTFPDDYKFNGAWTEAMRQIGNAVPVRLAKVIANSILNQVY